MNKLTPTKIILPVIAMGLVSFSLPAMAGKIGVAHDHNNLTSSSPLLHEVQAKATGKQAQAFIKELGNTAISFLARRNLSDSQKRNEFDKLLNKNFDMNTVARFAMGRYWRSASAAQKSEYLKLFPEMVIDVYSARFSEYNGETFKVTSYRADGKSDFLVNSLVSGVSGGSALKIDWRVRNKNGQMKVIDVIVEGVSMTLTQRSDFASIIQRGGGDVEALLKHLRK